MLLFVGLGNHGGKYAKNRHNIGFMTMDMIVDDEPSFSPFRKKFHSQISEGRLGNQKIILQKPETYMNNSGQAVAAAVKFYKIAPEHIFVFHDELDIQSATCRVKKGGGNAGHNGLKSIQAHLSTPDFWRVRMGIGRPPHNGDVSNYVLGDFSREERIGIDPLIENAVRHLDLLIGDDVKAYEQRVSAP